MYCDVGLDLSVTVNISMETYGGSADVSKRYLY
jgi:hypothetical protein